MIGAQAARRIRTQILTLVAIVFAATALTFAVTEILPGDAAVAILGDTATEADIKSLRAELGLERPLVVRYVDWVAHAMTGDLGRSYRTRESIALLEPLRQTWHEAADLLPAQTTSARLGGELGIA